MCTIAWCFVCLCRWKKDAFLRYTKSPSKGSFQGMSITTMACCYRLIWGQQSSFQNNSTIRKNSKLQPEAPQTTKQTAHHVLWNPLQVCHQAPSQPIRLGRLSPHSGTYPWPRYLLHDLPRGDDSRGHDDYPWSTWTR